MSLDQFRILSLRSFLPMERKFWWRVSVCHRSSLYPWIVPNHPLEPLIYYLLISKRRSLKFDGLDQNSDSTCLLLAIKMHEFHCRPLDLIGLIEERTRIVWRTTNKEYSKKDDRHCRSR